MATGRRVLPALVVAAACAADGPAAAAGQGLLGPGDHEITIAHGGRTRSALVHVPPRSATRGPMPLVLAFHGGGGEARGFAREAGLDALADAHGFVVVYPFGTGPFRRRLLTWNAGPACCGWAQQRSIDDVGFAVALIDAVADRVSIEARRVYATGHSNGAMMAYRLGAERADRIAAIAAVGGAMSLAAFAPSRPLPVLHIHSVDDPRALYGGGLGPAFPGTRHQVQHAAVENGLQQWREHNGCGETVDTLAVRAGAPGSPDAGQTATHLAWTECSRGAPVELWKLTGSGHGWPGHEASGRRADLIGPSTTLVGAATEAWSFLSRHRR